MQSFELKQAQKFTAKNKSILSSQKAHKYKQVEKNRTKWIARERANYRRLVTHKDLKNKYKPRHLKTHRCTLRFIPAQKKLTQRVSGIFT